jgi:biopolymer transport protein TolR
VTVELDRYIKIENQPININLLENTLRNVFANRSKKIVFLQADKDIPYGFIVEVMDIAKKAGVETVGLMTEPKEVKDKQK